MEDHIRNKDFSSIIKILDDSIEEVSTSGRNDNALYSQLYCNRGLCHQRLNINRKALKVLLLQVPEFPACSSTFPLDCFFNQMCSYRITRRPFGQMPATYWLFLGRERS